MPNKIKTKRAIISCCLIVSIIIGSTYALYTATDSKTNVFTFGNVDIILYENADTDFDGITEVYHDVEEVTFSRNIEPTEVLQKYPYIYNSGSQPAYVYVVCAIPVAVNNDKMPIYSIKKNDKWKYCTIDKSNVNSSLLKDFADYKLYCYYYEDILKPGEYTESLCESISVVNFTFTINTDSNLYLRGYAVQTQIANSTNPEEIFNYYLSKRGW